MNQGLMLLSPIVLVRLLSVAEFGQYREFLLYVSVLACFASPGFNNSLLYFIAVATPDGLHQLLKQTAALTAVSSILAAAVLVIADTATGGALTAPYTWAVVLYVLLYVNLDFWEFLWLARRQPWRVFAYATGRLAARMLVVITAAMVSGKVWAIIWAVIGFEALRLLTSAGMWAATARAAPRGAGGSNWGEQLRYCLPVAGAWVLVMLNKSAGNLAVTKLMGAASLAYYSIGTQIQPVITVLRNSLSDVLLPQMAQERAAAADRLELWRRATVMAMVLLVPAGVLLARFAHPIVTTLFSPQYAAAVPIFQIYALVLLREVFDFGVPLRAINRTTPIAHSNLLALAVNVGLLPILLPACGLPGAAIAFVIARWMDGAFLLHRVLRLYDLPLRQLARWSDLCKVGLANAAAAPLLAGSLWTDTFGLMGIVLGSLAYMLAVFVLLLWLRVPEVVRLARGLGRMPAGVP